MNLQTVAQECSQLLRAGYALLYLYSWEEDRVYALADALAKGAGAKLSVWTRTEGFGDGRKEIMEPLNLLREIQTGTEPGIYLLKDFHPFLTDALVVRAMRSALPVLRKLKRTILIVSPVMQVPRELEKDIHVMNVPLPTAPEIEAILAPFLAKAKLSVEGADKDALIRSAQGLTAAEIQRVFSRFLVGGEVQHSLKAVEMVHEEKSQILRRSRVLEFFRESKTLSEVGGLDQLKVWLKQREAAFSDKARTFGLPQPKGLFLLGVQGCGKSLMAKAAAGYWHLPLLRLDVAALVSQSSGAEGVTDMADALKVAESLSPVVLWLDEIEKAFSGMNESGSLARNFGTLITWMQEKTSPVFVVATANSIERLPPELMRKGRFDEVFFVDLPNIHERKEIWDIHLKNRKRDPKKFPIDELAGKTDGFSGAEIEQAIIDALFLAFSENRDLMAKDLSLVLEDSIPLSSTMEEAIKALKEWARTRARRASSDTRRIDYFAN